MKCPNCGAERVLDGSYCSYCKSWFDVPKRGQQTPPQQPVAQEQPETKPAGAYQWNTDIDWKKAFQQEAQKAPEPPVQERVVERVVERTVYVEAPAAPVSPKSRAVTLALCIFGGVLGLHRFYVGKTWTGIAYLLTYGLSGFGALFDMAILLFGHPTDKQGLPLEWKRNKRHS